MTRLLELLTAKGSASTGVGLDVADGRHPLFSGNRAMYWTSRRPPIASSRGWPSRRRALGVNQAVLLVGALPETSPGAAELAARCNSANYSSRLDDTASREAALDALRSAVWMIPSWAVAPWHAMIFRFEVPF